MMYTDKNKEAEKSAAAHHSQTAAEMVIPTHDLVPASVLQHKIMSGPYITAQRQMLQRIFPSSIVQRIQTDEEELQTVASDNIQLEAFEDEELVQGKFSKTPVQRKENTTGMPDNLKAGVENLSGFSLDHVQVHYNSEKPAQLNAHAYAQGADIHLASGQEQHLPHEAWHVVQQMQGRVSPTMNLDGVAINDDTGLEKEADVMGAKALDI